MDICTRSNGLWLLGLGVAVLVVDALACTLNSHGDLAEISGPDASAGGALPDAGVGGGGKGGTIAEGGAGGVGGTGGAGGGAGSSGQGGVGGAGGCAPSTACGGGATTCEETDGAGCKRSCVCVEGQWSCTSSCCASAPVAGLSCTTQGAQCNNACGSACTCAGGTWQCANGTCLACPAPELSPANGDPCTSDVGAKCSYAQSYGTKLCSCVPDKPEANAWACTVGTGGAGGSAGADGGSGPCVSKGSCAPDASTCTTLDSVGCTLSCSCVEGQWSCASSCCEQPPVFGKSCATANAVCTNVCGKTCTCSGGTWSCNGACKDCPTDPLSSQGDACYSDEGTTCTIATTSGSETCTCVAQDAAKNAWSCQ